MRLQKNNISLVIGGTDMTKYISDNIKESINKALLAVIIQNAINNSKYDLTKVEDRKTFDTLVEDNIFDNLFILGTQDNKIKLVEKVTRHILKEGDIRTYIKYVDYIEMIPVISDDLFENCYVLDAQVLGVGILDEQTKDLLNGLVTNTRKIPEIIDDKLLLINNVDYSGAISLTWLSSYKKMILRDIIDNAFKFNEYRFIQVSETTNITNLVTNYTVEDFLIMELENSEVILASRDFCKWKYENYEGVIEGNKFIVGDKRFNITSIGVLDVKIIQLIYRLQILI